MENLDPRPYIVAVALTKGGTGKTTTAANVATEIARLFCDPDQASLGMEDTADLPKGAQRAPRRVLLVDADPQGQTAPALGARRGDHPGLDAVLDAPDAQRASVAASALIRDVRPGLDVCPAGPDLAGAAARLASDPSAGLLAVADALDALAAKSSSPPGDALGSRAPALVIVDVPPGWGPLALGVLAAASHVISPVALHPLALDAVATFAGHLDGVQRTRARFGGPGAPRLPVLARIVPTMLDRRASASSQVLAALEARARTMDRGDGQPPDVGPPIPYSVALQEAAAFGQSAREHAGASHPTSKAYAALAAALLTDLQ